MNKIFFILFLLLPVVAYCGDNKKGSDKDKKKKNKLIQVSRWREVQRMSRDSAVAAFSDTLFIAFEPKDSFTYHYKGGFVYDGAYTISEDSIIDFGTTRFKVLERKGPSLVLINATGIFRLVTDSTRVDKAIVIANDTATPVTNIDQMIGHWTVYKRTAEGPSSIDMVKNIKAVFITGPSTDGKLGFVYGGNDANNNPSWYVKTYGTDQVLQCEGANQRTIKVLRCQKGELILEEDEIKYYFKQFK